MPDLPFANSFFQELEKIKETTSIKINTITNGKPVELTGEIEIFPAFQTVELIVSRDRSYKLNYGNLKAFCACIDTLAYAPSMYGTFPDSSKVFKTLYRVEDRAVSYYGGTTKQELCMTCVDCGIFLPRRYMQMDHQRPQVDGQTESVAKVLRVLGLTQAEPKGEKCTQLRSAIRIMMDRFQIPGPGLLVIFTNGEGIQNAVTPKKMRLQVNTASTLNQRYSLNETGTIFYSLVIALRKREILETRTMHSLANIRPLCSNCNGSRGNRDLKYR